MKKTMLFLLTIFLLFLTYLHFEPHRTNYVSLGDGIARGINSYGIESYNYNDYVYEYLKTHNRLRTFNNHFDNPTINGMTNDITKNRTIRVNDNEYYLKKVLRESDFVVLSLGEDELSKNYEKYDMEKNYVFFNKMIDDISQLIQQVKLYAKGQILFLGYYNPTNYYDSNVDQFFYHMDITLNEIMLKNNIIYLDIYDIVKSNQYKENNNYLALNYNGHKKIASLIEYYLD